MYVLPEDLYSILLKVNNPIKFMDAVKMAIGHYADQQDDRITDRKALTAENIFESL